MQNKCPVVIFPKAISDLGNILDYLKKESGSQNLASSFLDDLDNSIDLLSAFPNSGNPIDNEFVSKKGLRKVLVQRYVLVYRFLDGRIQILRIFHSKSNYLFSLDKY